MQQLAVRAAFRRWSNRVYGQARFAVDGLIYEICLSVAPDGHPPRADDWPLLGQDAAIDDVPVRLREQLELQTRALAAMVADD